MGRADESVHGSTQLPTYLRITFGGEQAGRGFWPI
jgi:hypothetical protein